MGILDVLYGILATFCHLIGDNSTLIVGLINILSKLLDLRASWQKGSANKKKQIRENEGTKNHVINF